MCVSYYTGVLIKDKPVWKFALFVYEERQIKQHISDLLKKTETNKTATFN